MPRSLWCLVSSRRPSTRRLTSGMQRLCSSQHLFHPQSIFLGAVKLGALTSDNPILGWQGHVFESRSSINFTHGQFFSQLLKYVDCMISHAFKLTDLVIVLTFLATSIDIVTFILLESFSPNRRNCVPASRALKQSRKKVTTHF